MVSIHLSFRLNTLLYSVWTEYENGVKIDAKRFPLAAGDSQPLQLKLSSNLERLSTFLGGYS